MFDLKPKLGIVAAGLSEEGLTLLGRALQRGMEEFLCSTPTLVLHRRLCALIIVLRRAALVDARATIPVCCQPEVTSRSWQFGEVRAKSPRVNQNDPRSLRNRVVLDFFS